MICMQRTFHQKKLFQPNIQEQKKAISLARFRPMDIKLKRHQKGQKLVINEDTAPIVRQIFDWTFEGKSQYEVTLEPID